jgi:hypothetical protein
LARLPAALAAKGVTVIHLKPVTPTLEDVFMQLLESDSDPHQPRAHS